MTTHNSSLPACDAVKLAILLPALAWMALDWQGYSNTVNATALVLFGLIAAFGAAVGPAIGHALRWFSTWIGQLVGDWFARSLKDLPAAV